MLRRGGGKSAADPQVLTLTASSWLHVSDQRDDFFGKALHLLELRTALEEQQAHAGVLELANAVRHLLGSSDETGTQAAVGHGVVLQRHALLELRIGEPVLIVVI